MDPEALSLQERLHRDNQERLQRMEKLQIEQIGAIARIEENTKHLPDMDRRIRVLERHRERQNGAFGVLNKFGGLIGVLVGAAFEWLLHLLWSK